MIYLDNYATTQIDPRVLDSMLPFLKENFGNPSSKHKYGWIAMEAIEKAREQVSKLINCKPHQIIFTSGATESNNIILQCFKHIITSSIEHSSILEICKKLNNVIYLKTDYNGQIRIDDLWNLIPPELISIMYVNNEIGTIQEIDKLDIIRNFNRLMYDTYIHSDITQAIGKIKVDVSNLNLDFASFSGHKIYGPKGIGVLFVKEKISPLFFGGEQEFGIRPGTQNVPAIVGLGQACEIINNEFDDIQSHILLFKNIFIEELKNIPNIGIYNFHNQVVNGLNIYIPIDTDLFLSRISEKVAFSLYSACKPSNELSLKNSIRVCIGRFNTEEDIKNAVKEIGLALKEKK